MAGPLPQPDGPPERLGAVGVFSPGIARIPYLERFLGARETVFWPSRRRLRQQRQVDAVVGWGRKPNTARARRYAAEVGCPYLMLEDGFVRSVRVGAAGEPPLSMVVDDLGIYYDATAPSRLERMLEGPPEAPQTPQAAQAPQPDPLEDPELLARAARCIARIRRERLSKYNAAPTVDLGPARRERVLVVDQTAGDLSVRLGLPHPGGFSAMLEAALDEHPDAEVVVKTHPNAAEGHRGGALGDLVARERVRLLTEPANPVALLEQVDAVYAMTSLMGFEALMAGRPVSCFGAPFYAGWGLTDDRVPVPRRSRRRSLEQLFAAAYLRYSRYVDPETGARCELERVLEHLAVQRTMAEANAGTMVCIGFSVWKRGFVPAFLKGPRSRVRFDRDAAAAERRGLPDDAKLVVWGSRESEADRRLAERHGLPLWRMEDGFLRSVGLGSDLYVPASLVVDRLGIYYDPTRPSELERLLQTADFSDEERARAAALRAEIVAHGISKYNVGRTGAARVGPPEGDGRPVVLVVGQVEDDASIRLGCPGLKRNEDLLAAAREARPDAYVVFKPHPDVVSGNRQGAVPPARARALADEVVEDAALSDCLAVATEVHTLTSLVGFEALLRQLPVVVYGQPFYGGWGLTEDRHPHPRRTRRLALDELVAGTLVRYPRYVSRRTHAFTTPEVVVHQLREARAADGGRFGAIRTSWPARQIRKGTNLVRGALHAS